MPSSRNKTISLRPEDAPELARLCAVPDGPLDASAVENRVLHGDFFDLAPRLPEGLCDLVIADPPYNRTRDFGGEVFPIKQYRKWKKALPDVRYINLYGPTETTGVSMYYEVDRDFEDDDVIPLGRPFENVDIFLLDENNKETDEGEICMRGTCVTLGYYQDPERTSAAFVQNPLNNRYPELIYKTGDIARRNERGELVFVSRKDFQIKHMGHRVELGEIECDVNSVEGIVNSCAVYLKKKDRIELYYEGRVEEKELLSYLKEKLPRYMVPTKVHKLEKLPLTPNGKTDRKGLTALSEGKRSTNTGENYHG